MTNSPKYILTPPIINPQQAIHLITESMSIPALQVQNYRYPFAQSIHQPAKIVELQYFKSVEQLQQKKKELTKKVELINNPSIIKMESIQERGMTLVYHYEFVPHSFESYLRGKWRQQSAQIWSMNKKFFKKKIIFELTLLTSYLGKMKIQTELALHHLGISKDQKLKLYISPKSKMGIKPEIQLIIAYNQNKQKILKELQNIYSLIENNIQNNSQRTYEPSQNMNNSREDTSQVHSLRQTRKFNNSQSFRPRKMSSGHFQLNSNSNLFKNFDKQQDNKSKKSHKYSFQFGNPSEQSRFHHNNHNDRQQEPQRSYSKAKSIKIEVEQKQNLDPRRKRKDSYKVKITTVREYDLGQNPTHLFTGRSNNEEEIFQYFAKRSKDKMQQDKLSQDPEKYEDPNKKETIETKFSNQQILDPPLLFSPHSMKQRKKSDNSTSQNRMLEQRIRQAKERTTKALNLIKNLKK